MLWLTRQQRVDSCLRSHGSLSGEARSPSLLCLPCFPPDGAPGAGDATTAHVCVGKGVPPPHTPLGPGTEIPPLTGGTDAKSGECSGPEVQVLFHTDLEFHRVASSVPTCYSQKRSDGHWAGTLPSRPESGPSQVWWKTSWQALPSSCSWQSLSSSLSYFHQILCFLNSFGRETSYLDSWLVSYGFRIVYFHTQQMLTGHSLCVLHTGRKG